MRETYIFAKHFIASQNQNILPGIIKNIVFVLCSTYVIVSRTPN